MVSIFLLLAFVGGFVGLAALWTQSDIDRAGKRDLLAEDKSDEMAAQHVYSSERADRIQVSG